MATLGKSRGTSRLEPDRVAREEKKEQAQKAAEEALQRLGQSLKENRAVWVEGWDAGLTWAASQASYQQLWRLSRIGLSRLTNVMEGDDWREKIIKFLREVLDIADGSALPGKLMSASSSSYVLGFIEGAQRVFNTVKSSLKPPSIPRHANG